MLKRVKTRRLSRSKGARKALLKGIALSLIELGSIETSEARAKGVRSFIQSVLRVSENHELDLRRITSLLSIDRKHAEKVILLGHALPVGSSATRIIRLGGRAGDMSPRVKLELLAKLPEKPKVEKKAKVTKGKDQRKSAYVQKLSTARK